MLEEPGFCPVGIEQRDVKLEGKLRQTNTQINEYQTFLKMHRSNMATEYSRN